MAETPRPLIARDPPTADEIREAEQLIELDRVALPSIRTFAERWRNAGIVSAALGVGTAFVTAPASIAGLSTGWKLACLLELSVGFAAAVVSISLAVRASFGWPKVIQVLTPLSLQNWEHTEANKSKNYVRLSMIFALVVAVCLGAALITSLAAPRDQVSVTLDNGRTLCGSSIVISGGQQTLLTPEGDVRLNGRNIAFIGGGKC